MSHYQHNQNQPFRHGLLCAALLVGCTSTIHGFYLPQQQQQYGHAFSNLGLHMHSGFFSGVTESLKRGGMLMRSSYWAPQKAVHEDVEVRMEALTIETSDVTTTRKRSHPQHLPLSTTSTGSPSIDTAPFLPPSGDVQFFHEWVGRMEVLCEQQTTSTTATSSLESSDDERDEAENNPSGESETQSSASKSNADKHEEDLSDAMNDDGDDDDDDEAAQRRKMLARAAMLRRSKGATSTSRSSTAKQSKSASSTSVGSRRVGSASLARGGPGMTQKIMDALRKSASAQTNSSREDGSSSNNNIENKDNDKPLSRSSKAAMEQLISAAVAPLVTVDPNAISTSNIHSIVMELMERQMVKLDEELASGQHRSSLLMGDVLQEWTTDTLGWERRPDPIPKPGTVLVPATMSAIKRGEKLVFPDCLTVRTATPEDDMHVANLRLSVFSNFSKDIRQQFCARSCKAIVSRRMQGATCIVATVPPSIAARKRNRPPSIVGSAECSFHEFYGTQLGQRRPQHSILYITEVAVSPNARRRGVGGKLLQAIHEIANLRGVETVYLHVDVENRGAISLYENAGYRKIDMNDPMYLEFTTSLNLHDGATKGRNHFLLCKDMVLCPTWLPLATREAATTTSTKARTSSTTKALEPVMGSLGFEIPF